MMDGEWIKAGVAVRRLGLYRGGRHRAAAFLVEQSALGLIHARADLRIETRARGRRLDEVTEYHREDAGRWIWAASRDRHARVNFDWLADTFTAWEALAPEGCFHRVKQVELVGVEFSAAEVDGLVPDDLREAMSAPPPAASDRTGAPGAPSSMHLVERIMRDRFAAGTYRPQSMAAEAEELHRIFAANPDHAGLVVPTAKTIKNSLGSLYRTLKNDRPK